jgi:beta-mannosidase
MSQLPLLAALFGGVVIARAEPPSVPIHLTNGWELQDVVKIPQKGEVISTADFQPSGWHRAVVPGTVLTSLVNDGTYPDPLYGENNRKIPDSLCRTAYWYRTPFLVPEYYSGRQVWLTFKGINYTADVWVNGKQVGQIKGAFARGIFDVTSAVNVGKTNTLAVLISPQPHPGETHEKTVANGTGLNGGVTAADGPSFMCTIGWDWIPTIRDRNMGIWQDVILTATGPVVIQDPVVTSELPLPRTDTADLTVETIVKNATGETINGLLTGNIETIKFQRQISLKPNETRTVVFTPADTPALKLKNPRLWWPNGFGKQELYTLNLSFLAKSHLSDFKQINFGIRQLRYALTNSDNLALSVNGVPVMVKGGNWGMDEAMKRIPRDRLEAEVRMHALANYTLIRNWVGQSTSEDLYDLCDRYGIMMWDEFFQPNPCDGPNPDDVNLYLTNVREKILRFRYHPCIALWCARNEGNPPPEIGDGIQKLIKEFDPYRLYQASSTDGRGVNSGGPYFWRTPREFYTFGEAFKTEIGSMSVPTLEAIKAMMPSNDWETINDDWAEHDFCAGAQAGDRYPHIITSRYGAIANLADFTRKAQLANFECYRAMYEGRFAKLFTPATGVITWMSAPCQPSFVWQLYSHDLEPNASLYGARHACEPIHIQLNQNNWHVMVINNTPVNLEGATAKIVFCNLDGTRIDGPSLPVTARASAATDICELEFPKNLSATHFVKLTLTKAGGEVISENFYWRAQPEHEDDFQALNTLPEAKVEVQTVKKYFKGRCLLDVTLRNTAPVVALMTHLQLRQADAITRVLPVYYSDNYVSLLPGESRHLTIDAAVAQSGGDPVLMVDGWNVTVDDAAPKAGSIRIALNGPAHVTSTTSAPVKPIETVRVNCGGIVREVFRFGSAPAVEAPSPGVFQSDGDFAGGDTTTTRNTIDTSAPGAAPQSVYQSERWGEAIYTFTMKAGQEYSVRLHFAEAKLQPGQRKFHVELNGKRVLENFDIAADAGLNKALVKTFDKVAPDASGRIVIALKKGGQDMPKICGIEIQK